MAIYPYETEPLVDFNLTENQEKYRDYLRKEREKFGKQYPDYCRKGLNGKHPSTPQHGEIIGQSTLPGRKRNGAAKRPESSRPGRNPRACGPTSFKVFCRFLAKLSCPPHHLNGNLDKYAGFAEAIDFGILRPQIWNWRIDDKVLSRKNFKEQYR